MAKLEAAQFCPVLPCASRHVPVTPHQGQGGLKQEVLKETRKGRRCSLSCRGQTLAYSGC